MSSLRSAVRWNVATAPLRVALGLASTALIARLLVRDGDAGDLACYAALYAASGSLVLATSLGFQQVFSRLSAAWIARGDRVGATAFLDATLLIRAGVWVLAGALALVVHRIAAASGVTLPARLDALHLLAMVVAWAAVEDASSLAARALAARLEQRWSNLLLIASQLVSVSLLCAAFAVEEVRLEWAVGASIAGCIVRFVGCRACLGILDRDAPGLRPPFPVSARAWRGELGQVAWAGLEKACAYAYSPAFVLMLVGSIAGAEPLAVAFLVLDLATKVVGVVALPVSGLVLPAIALAERRGALHEALETSSALQAVLLAAVVPAGVLLAGPAGVLLYGSTFASATALAGFALGVLLIEHAALEVAGAAFAVQRRGSTAVALRAATACAAVAAALAVDAAGGGWQAALAAMLAVRAVSAVGAPSLVGATARPVRWHALLMLGLVCLLPFAEAPMASWSGGAPLGELLAGAAAAVLIGVVLAGLLRTEVSRVREALRR